MSVADRAMGGVLPVAFIAAILALYPSPVRQQDRPAVAVGAAHATPGPPTPATPQSGADDFEAVRPVLQIIAEAMNRTASDDGRRLAVMLDDEMAIAGHQATTPGPSDADAERHRVRQRDAAAARRSANVRLIEALARGPDAVRFVTALVPDYVDSQSGWVADHVIAGIQAGFADAGYSLDRFYLPDRGGAAAAGGLSLAHERQPGALLFRSQRISAVHPLYVVLLVLETPTAGPHPRALANAIGLQRELDRVRQAPSRPSLPLDLQILGPTFSGSIDPLIAVLDDEHVLSPLRVYVTTGSANATDNPRKMQRTFIASYRQFVSDFEDLRGRVDGFLDRRGYSRCDIAILVEATSFGASTRTRPAAVDASRSRNDERCVSETTFRFPLHVSQLRTSSSVEPMVLRSLFAPPSVPVDIRETPTAADFVPALEPGMVSPTVEVTFRTLLKAIRLGGFRAVGIVATDARDVLFLSRELRRAAPSVQLVLFGAQALYLHADYAPFMRGALVASTFPLAPVVEPRFSRPRVPLPSQESHGVLRAVQHVLRPQDRHDVPRMAPDDAHAVARLARADEVWLSVIGSDAFWPIAVAPHPRGIGVPRHPSIRTWLLLLACVAFVGAFLVEVVRAFRVGRDRRGGGMLAPAGPGRWATFAHAVNVAQVGMLVAVVAFSATFVGLAYRLGADAERVKPWASVVAGVVAWLSVCVAVHAVWQVRRGAWRVMAAHVRRLRQRCGKYGLPPMDDFRVVAAVAVGILVTASSLLATSALMQWAFRDLASTDDTMRAIGFTRLLAGGVVSPVPVVMCVVGGLLIPVVWERNRGTPLGKGYLALYQRPAFRYLFGASATGDANLESLVASLEMPLPSLRTRRLAVVVIVAIVLIVAFEGQGLTLDGRAFSHFLLLATVSILLRVTILLLQATQTWRRLRASLRRMAHEPFMPALQAVRSRHVVWNVSLLAARVGDLWPILRLVDRISPASPQSGSLDTSPAARRAQSLRRFYAAEIASDPRVPIARSRAWRASWTLVEALVPMLGSTVWAPNGRAAGVALATESAASGDVSDAELLVALNLAFILRDMVSRVVSTMTNAVASLGLLTLGHLLYMFQGRSVFLLFDMLFLVAAAGVALWLLVAVERDFVLSVLRDTRPWRVEFNAGFVKSVAAYVILPIAAALGAVFPEIGIHFTGIVDPLRRLLGQ